MTEDAAGRVLIAGGTKGIGLSVASPFLAYGNDVVLFYGADDAATEWVAKVQRLT